MLDATQLHRAQRGEPKAVAALLEHYGRLVYGLCITRCDDPEDAYQEVWERILKVLKRFDPAGPASLSTWLHHVVRNYLVDRGRRRQHPAEPLDQNLATSPRLDDALDQAQRTARLRTALAQLAEPHRRVVVLHYLKELSVREVAELEGIPPGTVKSRLHTGRARLLELLGTDS